jgi:hypothetical protein
LDSFFFRFSTLPPSRMTTSCSNTFPSMVTEPNCVSSILGSMLPSPPSPPRGRHVSTLRVRCTTGSPSGRALGAVIPDGVPGGTRRSSANRHPPGERQNSPHRAIRMAAVTLTGTKITGAQAQRSCSCSNTRTRRRSWRNSSCSLPVSRRCGGRRQVRLGEPSCATSARW